MPTDIRLDERDGNWIVVDSAVLKLTGADLIVDAPSRRISAHGFRRALVHDAGDGLTINFNRDYPGGVTIHGPVQIVGDLEASGDVRVAGNLSGTGVGGLEFLAARINVLEDRVIALTKLVDAAFVPAWTTREEVEEGDSMGLILLPAHTLGLEVVFDFLQDGPEGEHIHVVRIVPSAGTLVRRGSTVTVTLSAIG